MNKITLNKKPICWMSPHLCERKSNNGFGTFALKHIKKGALLMIFGGYILSYEEEEKLPKEIRDIAIQIERNFVIGPVSKNQNLQGNFVNHSCEPTAGIRGQISLYSMKNIKKNEEITFDYATVLFSPGKKVTYKMPCMCGTKTCRKTITDQDWRQRDLQKKYRNFFSFYILDEIDKGNTI